tara:strand:+ start:70 stop:567 length:498 start_codon:yes stop_codon:yes gene_type:complete
VTNRSIFNRRYTSYSPAGVEVYLLNGAGISSQLNPTFDFELGEDLDSGSVVYVSGAVIYAASAASGVSADLAYAVGITTVSGNAGATVPVVTDEIATVDSQNITHQSTLTPGRYYYLSNVAGQVTAIPPSGITLSGGYQASTLVGMALTQSDIHLEIDGPVFLTP